MAHDFSYTQNRELSWLGFNERVLEESMDPSVPLFERMKFVSIFTSNLDEFFMIRVGGLHDLSLLKKEPVDNKSNQTPSEQLHAIFTALPRLMDMRTKSFNKLEKELSAYGIERVTAANLNEKDLAFVEDYYRDYLLPIISPQIIDPRHPFPNLRNMGFYLVYNLNGPEGQGILGMIEVPASVSRVVELPAEGDNLRYILIEDVMLACADDAFGADFKVTEKAVIRVTRNADINPDDEIFDEDDDYRQHMKRVLKKRLRLQPVRLEVQGKFNEKHIKFIRKLLGLSAEQVFTVKCPLEFGYIFGLEDDIPQFAKSEILYREFSPQPSVEFDPSRSIMEQIEERDRLLFFPYESMTPYLELMNEAAYDPSVISIKITLYRIAKKSKLAESLIAAAENGKEVTVLMELRARFDEENNIEWAERLEEAGCIVSYGQEGFKVHSKICQITRRVDGKISRITQLGTGNYNEKTAKLYSDISLMTANEQIGEDANAFFRNMSLSNLDGKYDVLGVAPFGLKPLIVKGIDREIARAKEGKKARIYFKMNSLTDRDIIDKLSEASNAGVEVKMIIRGISCLVPGIKGKTENIEIRSIVGRFLEHARIYAFGESFDTIYCSSADMMTRNTEHRTEIAFPILDPCIRGMVISILDVQLKDNVKARILGSDGKLHKIEVPEGEPLCDSQDWFMRQAIQAAADARLVDGQIEAARRKARQAVVAQMTAAPINPVPVAMPQAAPIGTPQTQQPAAIPTQPFAAQPVTPAAGAEAAAAAAQAGAQTAAQVQAAAQAQAQAQAAQPAQPAQAAAPAQGAAGEEKEGRLALFGHFIGQAFKALFGSNK